MVNISRKTIVLLALTLLLLAGLFFVFTDVGSRLERYYENKKAQAIVDQIEKPYREDIYGGSTPEETYALFIAALKKGNIELAAKYFSPKKQEEWKINFKKIREQNNFPSMINDLEKAKSKGFLYENNFQYEVVNENNEVVLLISLVKNKFTNKWKIESL